MRILDTCFLIDLHREWVRKRPGVATSYLSLGTSVEYGISVITALEFLEGYPEVADGERFLTPFPQLAVTTGVARSASRIRRSLRQRGEMIGDFDVLIAATALSGGHTLITGNIRHFARVDGLRVEGYGG
jgi:predicted nucleic acid-binding protein